MTSYLLLSLALLVFLRCGDAQIPTLWDRLTPGHTDSLCHGGTRLMSETTLEEEEEEAWLSETI